MHTPSHPFPLQARDGGSALLGAMCLATAVGGLAFGLLSEGFTAKRSLGRSESNLRSLEIAETGIAQAENELASGKDPDGNGVGTLSGTFGSGSFDVTATHDPVYVKRYTLHATAKKGLSVRRLEVGLRRFPGGTYTEGLFSEQDLVFDGTNSTDAYDSSKGAYASQAVHTDAGGTYAELGGSVGSNSGFIQLSGSSIDVRGDAIPGPLRSVTELGSPTVTGDTAPRSFERDLQATPLAEFQAALASNQNGTWTAVGGNLAYDAAAKSLSFKAGGVLTFPAGTYFFSSFSLLAGSTVVFSGATRIYVTGSLDLASGTLLNGTGKPANLQIFAEPYALPAGFTPTSTTVKVSGGAGSAFVMYGPNADITISGGSDIFGAVVARHITINGNCRYHYDKALDALGDTGSARIERVYWREASPPRR